MDDSQQMSPAESLPMEILVHLFGYIDSGKAMGCAACVCRSWNEATKNPLMWAQSSIAELPQYWKERDISNVKLHSPNQFKTLLQDRAFMNRRRREMLSNMGEIASAHYNAKFRPIPRKTSRQTDDFRPDHIKIVPVGDRGIGKTSALRSYLQGIFTSDPTPSMWDDYKCTKTTAEGDEIPVMFWDTPGPEDIEKLRPLSYPGTTLAVIFFSLVDPSSFDKVKKTLAPEVSHYLPDVPFLLVGSKLDLVDDPVVLKKLADMGQAPITHEQGYECAKEIGAIGFIPFSSLTQLNLDLVFDTIFAATLPGSTTNKKGRCVVC